MTGRLSRLMQSAPDWLSDLHGAERVRKRRLSSLAGRGVRSRPRRKCHRGASTISDWIAAETVQRFTGVGGAAIVHTYGPPTHRVGRRQTADTLEKSLTTQIEMRDERGQRAHDHPGWGCGRRDRPVRGASRRPASAARPRSPGNLTTRSNLAYFRALAGDPAGVIAELEALLTGPRGVRPSLVKTSVRWHCTVCGETKSHVALSYWVGLRATRRHTTVGSVDVGDGAIQARTRRRVMSSARVHNHA
jgi:hypothetical protein